MLRELATLLQDIHAGIVGTACADPRGSGGLLVREVTMSLPVDMVAIFKDGGCRLLTDVARTASDTEWYKHRSQLHVMWRAEWQGEKKA
jgi:hypothetical protein